MNARWWCLAGLVLAAVLALAGCKAPVAGTDGLSVRVHAESGGGEPDCRSCHVSGSALDPAVLDSSTQGKHPKHASDLGFPCQTCHAGYFFEPTHINGKRDALDPNVLVVGFQTPNDGAVFVGSGNCANTYCHDGFAPHWYTDTPWVVTDCTVCHYWAMGSRRIIAGPEGDFRANAATISGHVAGGADPTESQCEVCHDISTHRGGQVRLAEADGGAAVVYDPLDASTLEPFCLSCHDLDGATVTAASGGSASDPFNDGRTLGAGQHVAGDKIEGYWNNAYTVHRTAGVTCVDCHGNAGVPNGHGSPEQGLLTQHLSLPVPNVLTFSAGDYRLCFDCHDSAPAVSKEVVLGYKQGGNYDLASAFTPYPSTRIGSLFRDRYISDPANYPAYWPGGNQPYNDILAGGGAYRPLHNLHLGLGSSAFLDVWLYRDGSTGRATCVTCHNVHGTSGTVRSVYDEFGIVVGGSPIPPDEYKTLVNNTDATMLNPPISCSASCHTSGQRSYWHEPSDE
jgi:hypothetical protein